MGLNNMWIKDIFSKRTPNHLIVYYVYNHEEEKKYKFLSKITYSIGPCYSFDECIEGIKKFIKKHPGKLKNINLTSYGSGKYLIQTSEDKKRIVDVINSLQPIMNNDTKIMFTTCYSGVSYRKVVEMSENINGKEVYAMNDHYSLHGKMAKCKCKETGYSKKVVESLPLSKNGILYDEKQIIDIVRRNDGEKINWISSGMAYEYNKIVTKDGICTVEKQPYTLLKCIRNYIFNIQS